jgi:hypothetical protein
MSGPYADEYELEAWLGTAYAMPADVDRILERASEVVDDWTLGRAEYVFTDPDGAYSGGSEYLPSPGVGGPTPALPIQVGRVTTVTRAQLLTALSNATCAQVEFWLEVGEEYDVASLGAGASVQAGRVQVNRLPPYIGRRAARILRGVGFSRGVQAS